MSSFRKAKVKVVLILVEEAIKDLKEFIEEDKKILETWDPEGEYAVEDIEKSIASSTDHLIHLEKLKHLVSHGKGTMYLSMEDAYILAIRSLNFDDGIVWAKSRKWKID